MGHSALRNDDDVTMRRLRVFLTVVETGSISAAAQRLSVSQPAVTQQVRALEEGLNARLFNRQGRNLTLTEAGRQAVLVSRELLAQVDGALSTLRDAMRTQELVLRVGFTAPQTALPAIKLFRDTYPDAQLEIVSANTDILFEKLRKFEVDTILVGLERELDGFHCRPYLEQRLVAMIPNGHPWTGRDDLSIDELCDEPLICRERGSYTRKVLFEAAEAAGKTPTLAYEIATRESVHEAVAQGLGPATVLHCEHPPDPRVRIVEIEGGRIKGREFVVCHRDLAGLPPVSHFLDLVGSGATALT